MLNVALGIMSKRVVKIITFWGDLSIRLLSGKLDPIRIKSQDLVWKIYSMYPTTQ